MVIDASCIGIFLKNAEARICYRGPMIRPGRAASCEDVVTVGAKSSRFSSLQGAAPCSAGGPVWFNGGT